MKRTILLGACALFAAGATARSDPPSAADLQLKLASTRLEQGEHEMTLARAATTAAAKLDAWDRAIARLRQARTAAWKGRGETFETLQTYSFYDLVRALDAESEIYFARKSLPLAKDRDDAALELDPTDAPALNLAVMIRAAEETDIYDVNQGRTAVDRIRAQRAAAGMALRDRGIANRR